MDTITDTLINSMPDKGLLTEIGLSFVFWNVINLIVMSLTLPDGHLKREDRLDMRNRIVSFFHGCFTLTLTGYHMYFLHSECGAHNTTLE